MKLNFVWSTPCGLSKVWMHSIIEDLADGEKAPLLMPNFEKSGESKLQERLSFLAAYLKSNATTDGDIYFELSYLDTFEDEILQDWLDSRDNLEIEFIGTLPANAVDFPKDIRDQIENFARASQSQIIVLIDEDDKEDPEWILNKDLDFGRHVEVHVQNFWFKDSRVAHLNEYFEPTEFERKPLEEKSAFTKLDLEKMKTQVLNLWDTNFGKFISLEFFELTANSLNCLQVIDKKLYVWKTQHPVFRELYRKETTGQARIQTCGFELNDWNF